MLILFLLTSVFSQCPSIKCGSLKYPKCLLQNSTYMSVSSCLPNEVCEFSSPNQTCTKVSKNRLAGDLCSLNSECISKSCISGLCDGPKWKESCSESQDCSPGFYCDGSICQDQLKEGMNCTFDNECSNYLFCNLGTCTGYWSLLAGDPVNPPVNGLSVGCKSAGAVQTESGWVCGYSDNSTALPTVCNPGTQCESDGNLYQSPCVCGRTSYGYGFCPLFPGDEIVISAISAAQDVLEINSKCNTNSRFSLNCFLAYPNDLEKFLAFAINYTLAFKGFYAKAYNASSCVNLTLNTELYELTNALENLNQIVCPAYYCPKDTADFSENQCIVSVNDSNFGVLSQIQYSNPICPWNYSCKYDSLTNNATCGSDKNESLGNPGDYCNRTLTCASNICYQHFCMGIRENEECVKPEDCMPGFYCNQVSFICESLKSKSQPCSHTYECGNHLLCNLGTCINFFSLDNNENTGNFQNGYSLACSSGFAIPDSNNPGQYICRQAPVSNKIDNCRYPGQSCTDITGTYSNKCTCSMQQNLNGETASVYCPLFAGDLYFQNVITNLKMMLNWNQVCNTKSRLSSRCFLRSNKYLGYYYFYITNLTMFINYTSLYGVQSCISRNYLQSYYLDSQYLKEWIKKQDKKSHDDDDSFAEWVYVWPVLVISMFS